MWKDFKEFALKGSMIDLAVGIIIGAAFGKVVTSIVNDILMPPLGQIMGKVDFSGIFIPLNGQSYPTLAAARAAGAPTLNVGLFANQIVDFTIVAACVFILVKQINRFRVKSEAAAPPPVATRSEALLQEIRDILVSQKAKQP